MRDPKRWPPHIFHPPSQAHPVPKWRNDAIPRERKSRRAPESYAPATFSPPRATRHRPVRARGAPRTTSGCSLRLFPSATLLRPPLRFFFPYSEGSRGVAEGKRRSRRPRTGTGGDRSRARAGAGLAARAEGVAAPADHLRAQRRPAAPFLAPVPAPLLPDAWNTGPMRCVRRTGCDLGRSGPVKRAESPDAGPKKVAAAYLSPPIPGAPRPEVAQ